MAQRTQAPPAAEPPGRLLPDPDERREHRLSSPARLPPLPAGRRGVASRLPHPVRRDHDVGGLPLLLARLDPSVLGRTELPFHLSRVRLGRAASRSLDGDPVRGARSARRLHRARALLPHCGCALLRRLHLRVPARAGAVPQPLLPRVLALVPARHRSRAPGLVRGCRAQQAALARDRPDLVALAASCPDRSRLLLCRGREAERRLAPRRAAAHVACGAHRLIDHRPLLHRGLGALALQLQRAALRPHGDSSADLAADETSRLPGRGRLPHDESATVHDRDLSVPRTGHGPAVLPARLAPLPLVAGAAAATAATRRRELANAAPGLAATARAGGAARRAGRLPRVAGSGAAPPFCDPGQHQLDRGGPSLLLAHEAPRQGRERAVRDRRRRRDALARRSFPVPDELAVPGDVDAAGHDRPVRSAREGEGRSRPGWATWRCALRWRRLSTGATSRR